MALLRELSNGEWILDFYDRHAVEYASRTSAHDLGFLLDPFCSLLPPGSRILDLGSGSGRDSLGMAARGFFPTSLDYSFPLLREHQNRIGAANRLNACLVQGDFAVLPFQAGVFAGVWACASLLHIPKSRLVSALQGIRRVLQSPGILFLSLKLGSGEEIDAEGRFWAFYNEGELKVALTGAGLRLIENNRTRDLDGRQVEWINILASGF